MINLRDIWPIPSQFFVKPASTCVFLINAIRFTCNVFEILY